MIKFFRHIRKSLLMENKTSKYFKYAIGEIILVVIGILIALQINNWNVEKNDNEYVSLMLKEIYYDLSDDYRIIYEGIEPRLRKMQLSINKIKEFMMNGKAPSDSIFMDYYKNMQIGISLTQRTGTFESLKLGGLNKLKNDSLRTMLLEFYESDIHRFVIFITEYDDYIYEKIGALEPDIFSFKFIAINDSITVHKKYPKNNEYLHHQSLHKIFNLIMEDAKNKEFRLAAFKKKYDKIMRMIERELEKRKTPFNYFDTSALKPDF
ncbi:MAG: hypothetical protein DA407_12835 [Bacteroidetes bacterium]|nr:MAG: hypothetical protein DA407_12835 [Bacteroidota bacterium]